MDDQREASGRPDVVAFVSEVLTASVKLAVSMNIFRGRYRESLETPRFVPSIFWAKPEDYHKATQRVHHAPGLVVPRSPGANAGPRGTMGDLRDTSAAK